ncbi:DMT family transporter [Nocardia sp. NPDC059691]|uniref:DMT family transporter n=1 Tax=unclassified Nocardia TaxID=2637762 RepID=UPI0036B5FA7C
MNVPLFDGTLCGSHRSDVGSGTTDPIFRVENVVSEAISVFVRRRAKDVLPMSLVIGLVFLFILVGGSLRSAEAGCQNTLMNHMKNMWLCAVISYAVALTGFSIFLALSSKTPWPTLDDVRNMPWWAPFGGLLGGAAVMGMIAVARHVGVATFSALVIVGEMVVAVIMDHFGLMGFEERSASVPRLVACGLITLAIYLMADEPAGDEPRVSVT